MWTHAGDFDIVSADVSVENGIVYSKEPELNARIHDAWYIKPLCYTEQENVKLVQSIISESTFENLFPLRNQEYKYAYFLNAIAAYPAFCNTSLETYPVDYICRRELATLLTHIIEDTNAER